MEHWNASINSQQLLTLILKKSHWTQQVTILFLLFENFRFLSMISVLKRLLVHVVVHVWPLLLSPLSARAVFTQQWFSVYAEHLHWLSSIQRSQSACCPSAYFSSSTTTTKPLNHCSKKTDLLTELKRCSSAPLPLNDLHSKPYWH